MSQSFVHYAPHLSGICRKEPREGRRGAAGGGGGDGDIEWGPDGVEAGLEEGDLACVGGIRCNPDSIKFPTNWGFAAVAGGISWAI